MTTAARTAIITTVSGLSDNQLLEQTGKLARLDHQIQVFVIDHLLEIEARKLYLTRGFSGLFDYVARGLGYSDAAAWRRINAMKLCAHVEGARERLRDGSLTLDAAAQLQAAFERRDRERARAARSAGAGAGATMRRNGAAPSASPLVPPPEPKPVPELDASARKALVEEAAGKSTRQVMKMLAEMDPQLVVPADRVRALSGGRWELKAVIDEECQRGLEQLKGLLSRVDPHMTLGQMVGRLVKEGLDRDDPGRPRRGRRRAGRTAGAKRTSAPNLAANSDGAAASAAKQSGPRADGKTSAAQAQEDPRHGAPLPAQRSAPPAGAGSSPANSQREADSGAPSAPKRSAQPTGTTTSPANRQQEQVRGASFPAHGQARPACNTTSAPKAGARASRAVPAAAKREIWQRDGGRCRYIDPRSGRRCPSRYLLQIDHMFPYSGRRRRARKPQVAVRSSPSSPPRGAGFTAGTGRVR